jgi:uncharacterized membrane protein YdjX (TVP38/TMEM64 family)
MDRNVFESAADRRAALLRLGALVGAVLLVSALVLRAAPFLLDPDATRAWVAGFGSFAPVVFLAVQSTQVVVAPIPGQLLAVAGGYLFGPLLGATLSVCGVLLGSAVAIGLTRRYGRPYAESVVADDTLAEFDAVVDETGEAGLFVAFLLPVFPDDALCFVAGLTDIPTWRLLVLVAVGRTPTFVAAAFLGDAVATANLATVALLLAAGVLFTALGYWKRRDLAAAVADARHDARPEGSDG